MKKRITITIDDKLLDKFKEICGKYGYKVSSKIERLVDEFVRGDKR